MARSSPKEILFVFHGQKQSKRNQELQDARRRAHAARHAARKNKEIIRVPRAAIGDELDDDVRTELVTRPQRGPVRRYPALPPIGSLLAQDEDATSLAQPVVNTPRGYLSQDMTDPFRTTIVGTLPTVLQRYLHDAQTVIWPSLVPLVPSDIAALFYRRSPVDSPNEIDHQIDAAAAISLALIQSDSPGDRRLLPQIAAIGRKHRERSIAWVNSKVIDAQGPPPSNVVGALLSLVSHSGLGSPPTRSKWPVSPVALGQLSAVFGASRVLPEDMRFLYSILELKGGDNWISNGQMDEDMPLKLMLNHFDIFVATRRGTPPMWRSMTPVPHELLIQYSAPDETDCPTESPTSHIEPLYVVLYCPTLRAAIHIMQIAARMLDLQTSRSPAAPPQSVMVHTRNMSQHQLLMLYEGPDHSQAPGRLQGITKLEGLDAVAHPAALLFSDLTLIPLPPTSGTRPRLLRELLSAVCAVSFRPQQTTATAIPHSPPFQTTTSPIRSGPPAAGHSPTSPSPAVTYPPIHREQSAPTLPQSASQPFLQPPTPPAPPSPSSPHQHLHQHLHIWAVLLLAIGSLTHHPSSPSESALVAEIDNYCLSYLSTQTVLPAEPGLESWDSVKRVSKQFLWWDYVLDAPGREVWGRVAAMKGAGWE